MLRDIDLPVPPFELASRVCSLEGHADPSSAYVQVGGEAKRAILSLLPESWSFAERRVLDFGCGAGRTLRHFMSEAAEGDVWGSDIDEPSIRWLQEHLCPPLHAIQNGLNPPVGLEHGTFDLIWAVSVFTHLTDNSLPWLVELHELLKPDGLLVATYMGALNGRAFVDEAWDEDRIGMNVLRRHQGWEAGGPMVLMSDWWVHEHWGRAFEFIASAPVHGQTWVLLRKRDVEIDVEELARPADDPREFRALQHNLRQVERDSAIALAELQAYYEHSVSWRLTRPLRRMSQAYRERGRLAARRSD